MFRSIIGDGLHRQVLTTDLRRHRISVAGLMEKTGEASVVIYEQVWTPIETLEAEAAQLLLTEHRKKFGE